MWMNIDAVPAGRHQYTAFGVPADQDWSNPRAVYYDEIDFVAPSQADADVLLAAVPNEDQLEIIGIADQSDGTIVYLSENGRKLM